MGLRGSGSALQPAIAAAQTKAAAQDWSRRVGARRVRRNECILSECLTIHLADLGFFIGDHYDSDRARWNPLAQRARANSSTSSLAAGSLGRFLTIPCRGVPKPGSVSSRRSRRNRRRRATLQDEVVWTWRAGHLCFRAKPARARSRSGRHQAHGATLWPANRSSGVGCVAGGRPANGPAATD